jgi:uncharacterized protein YbaR (Trm112 family)
MAIPKDLLDIMGCAFCKEPLRHEGEHLHCTQTECGLIYSIKDDIPIMLIDEAQRPCPGCSETRDWQDDLLKCPKCGKQFEYKRS